MRVRILTGAVIVFLAFVSLTSILTKGIVNDDTYITLRYSRNLAEYHQFTYNLGNPTYSLTTPLWAILLALLNPAARNFVLEAQIVATLLSFVAAIFLYKVSRLIVGPYALVSVIAFLLDPYLIGADYAGTEMALFASLAMIATYLVATGGCSFKRCTLIALLLALLIMTRPEGVLVLVILALCGYLIERSWARAKRMMFMSGMTLLMLLPWLMYASLHFKTVIPTSMILKSLDRSGRLPFSDPVTMLNFTILAVKGYFPYFAVIALAGVLVWSDARRGAWKSLFGFGRRDAAPGDAETRAIRFIPSLFVAGLILFYLCGLKEKAISTRYMVTFSPYLMMLTTQSVSVLFQKIPIIHKRWKAFTIVVLSLMLVINVSAVRSRVQRSATTDAPRDATGRWIAKNLSSTSVIANFCGAGAIAYYFDGQVWDFELISKMGRDMELAKKKRLGYDVRFQDYLYKKPDYFVLIRNAESNSAVGRVVYENETYEIIKLNKQEAPSNKED